MLVQRMVHYKCHILTYISKQDTPIKCPDNFDNMRSTKGDAVDVWAYRIMKAQSFIFPLANFLSQWHHKTGAQQKQWHHVRTSSKTVRDARSCFDLNFWLCTWNQEELKSVGKKKSPLSGIHRVLSKSF